MRCPITPHQLAALKLLAEGMTLEEVAKARNTSPSTIRSHTAAARAATGTHTTTHLVAIAIQRGWLSPENNEDTEAPREPEVIAAAIRMLGRSVNRLRQAVVKHDISLITAEQRAYVEAVAQAVEAHTPEEEQAAREALKRAVGPVLRSAGLAREQETSQASLTEVLVDAVLNP